MFRLAIASVAVAAIAFAHPAVGATAKAKCPVFKIETKTGDSTVTFTVTPASDALTYNWTVSAGTIDSGQGTNEIVVSVVGIATGEKVSATVDVVEGLDASCKDRATVSATAEIP